MTTETRLDRLEALAEAILLAVREESSQIAEMRQSIRETNQEIRTSVTDLVEMITTLKGFS